MNVSNIKISDKINKYSFPIYGALASRSHIRRVNKIKHATQNNIHIYTIVISNESLMQPNTGRTNGTLGNKKKETKRRDKRFQCVDLLPFSVYNAVMNNMHYLFADNDVLNSVELTKLFKRIPSGHQVNRKIGSIVFIYKYHLAWFVTVVTFSLNYPNQKMTCI